MLTRVLLVLVVLVQSLYTAGWSASLKLPAIISSGMVLQQQKTVMLWGWAKQGQNVVVATSWNRSKYSVKTAADGSWKVSITTPAAGGPYAITIRADTTLVLSDVLIGEVWMCSGQSNMEMPLKGYASQPVAGSNDYIARSADSQIRLFTVQRKISMRPEEDCSGEWQVAGPGSIAGFSAVAYFYGKYLRDVLQVPIGLVHASWGGTPAQSWISSPAIEEHFREEIGLFDLRGGTVNQRSPSVLYNGMVHPLVKFVIRGAIWYQGEADRMRPRQYARLFPAMIRDWRDQWGVGDFPFYFVQIAPYRYDSTVNSAFLREVQLRTMQQVPNTGMAVAIDVGDYNSIHPPDKAVIGARLAYWTLAKTYGIDGISFSGPVFRDMKIDENKIRLFFDYAESGFLGLGQELDGFTVAGSDRIFYPEVAQVNRKENCIEIICRNVNEPVAVRYGWGNYIRATLYNTAGLPASSFRTDSWEQ